MNQLQGKRAVVTGASSGIGKAIALSLAAAGADMTLLGLTRSRVEAVTEEVSATGVSPTSHVFDLDSDSDIARVSTDILSQGLDVSILVHAAGVHQAGISAEDPIADWDAIMRVNLRAAFVLTQQLLPSLRTAQGEIVFINSSAGSAGRAGSGGGPYAASKHALRTYADSLRNEVNPDGIRVLSVFPGRTTTPMQATILEAEGKAFDTDKLLQPSDIADTVLAAITLPRTAEVTDLHVRPMRTI